MELPKPPQRQVVLIGGGQTHISFLRMWGMRKMREAQQAAKAPLRAASVRSSETGLVSRAASYMEVESIVRPLLEESSDSTSRSQGNSSSQFSSGGLSGSFSRRPASSSRHGGYVPFSSVTIILVTDSPAVTYSAMIGAYICGQCTAQDLTIDLGPLCAFAGATLILARAEAVCPRERLVKFTGGRPPLYYDVLSICCGSIPKIPHVLSPVGTPREEEGGVNAGTGQPESTGPGKEAESSMGFHAARGSCLLSCWKDLCERIQLRFRQLVSRSGSDAGSSGPAAPKGGSPVSSLSSSLAGGRCPAIPRDPLEEEDEYEGEDEDEGEPPFVVAFVGGGAVGVEMALSFHCGIQREVDSMKKAAGHSEGCQVDMRVDIVVLTEGSNLLEAFSPKAQTLARKLMESRGIRVICDFPVLSFEKDVAGGGVCVSEDGRTFACDFCVVCTSASPQSFIVHCGLPLDSDGFLNVRPTLQSEAYPEVFAAGDTATIRGNPRPKAGVFAVRAATVLERNVWAYLRGQPLVSFKPQELFLSIVVTGEKEALLCRGSIVSHGLWAWRLKKYIDENWVESFRNLPAFYEEPVPFAHNGYLGGVRSLWTAASDSARAVASWIPFRKDVTARSFTRERNSYLAHFTSLLATASAEKHYRMRCNGCASKIPSNTLRKSLHCLQKRHGRKEGEVRSRASSFPLAKRSEVLVGLSAADDAALFCSLPPNAAVLAASAEGDAEGATRAVLSHQPVLAQSVDVFRFFSGDFYVMGKIAAAHALSDIYAMGAEPISALLMVNVPFSDEPFKANALLNISEGCASVLTAEGCELSGGHSSEGDEVASAGLAVVGRISGRSAEGLPGSSRGDDGVAVPQLLRESTFFLKGSRRVRDGCVLLLTKAIGTGVVFAAHGRGRANAIWVEEALQQMQQTNRAAMDVLKKFQACACTDVTGFGLAGHLSEMVEASNSALRVANGVGRVGVSEKNMQVKQSCPRRYWFSRSSSSSSMSTQYAERDGVIPGVKARIWLERVETLPGAVELTMDGVVSSLFLENAKVAKRWRILSHKFEERPPLVGQCANKSAGSDESVTNLAKGKSAYSREGSVFGSYRSVFGNFPRRKSGQGVGVNLSVLIFPLLFDPQTSGGLLAVVPPELASDCLKALKRIGPAAAIGRIVATEQTVNADDHVLVEVVP